MAGCSGFAGLGFNACGRVAVVAFSLFACQGAVAADAPLDPFSVTQAVRLAKMRADVATAKLKVGYPGKCYEPTEEEMKWKLDEFTPKPRKVAAVLDYYDIGEETIGYVEAKGKSCPKLYVGESVSEMRSTDKSGFEQTTEMREVSPGVWRSVVPLALRYFRFVGAVEEVRFLEDVDSSLVLKGAFSSMDPKMDRIWKAAARTVFLCSRHFIVDGVKRDRLPWAGDLSVSLLANAYTYADAETVKRTIAALETFRPETSDVNGLIDYSLWLVISHDLFQLYFGDMDFLRVQYPSIRSRLEVFARRADKDGLLRNDGFGGDGLGGAGGKIFVDWTPEIRDNVGDGAVSSLNMVYKGALDAGARLAERMGAKDDAERWRARANAVKAAARKRWLDKKTGLFGPLRYANFYAVAFDVAEKGELSGIGEALASGAMPPVGTPYCAYWQNAALVKCGFADVAMENVMKMWGGMLDDGATTFWEGWSEEKRGDEKYVFYRRPFANSLCHAWSASPAFFFAREIAGIRPLSDGWKTWAKNPLPQAEGMEFSVPTPRGEIKVAVPGSEGEARRTFEKARHFRGDTNVKALSGIDNASWIWAADEPAFVVPQGNEFRKFRIEFDSTEEAPHLDFSVSADSRYYLTIDGKFVSRGPNRSTTENWQFQSYRVALKPGRHVVEATVWQLTNTMAPLAQLTWMPGFVFYACEPYRSALTTGIAKWKCGKVDCIRRFDGKDTAGCGWATGGQWEVVGTGPYAFEPKEWKDVVEVRRPITAYGYGGRAPGWMLFPTQLPDQTETKVAPGRFLAAVRGEPMRAMYEYTEADTKSPDVAALNELVGKGKKFVVPPRTSIQAAWHLGEYICAYPVLRTNGGKGAKVSWTWAESPRTRGTKGRNGDGKKGRRDTIVGQYLNTYGDMFVCDGREGAEFSIPWFRCGLWCKIDIATADEPLEITGMELIESRYPLEDAAGFSSKDDPSLADIRRICRRAMQMCCHEMLFDCPYYEQQMYPGDTRVQLLVLSALSRDDRIIKRAIELYDLGTRDDGMCPFNWPTRGLQEGFTYTLCYLMMYGDYAMNHADRAWLEARIPGMRKSMAGCEIYENSRGLVENTPGWNFMDWTPGWKKGVPPGGLCGEGVNSEINLQWLLAVESAAKAERALGNELQAQYWDEKAERLKKAIVDAFWCEERGLLAETPDMRTFSEHSQAMAIIADALPKDKLERCAKALVEDPGLARCTVYFSYYLFEAYFKIGRADLFERRLDMWRGYVAKGVTTLLEAPDEGKNGQSEPRSDCHAWGAHPIWFMQTGLAGIKPAAPFFEKVLVEPQPGALKSFHVRHPHPKGFVEADLEFNGRKASGTVKTPVPGTFVFGGATVELKPGCNAIQM